MYLNLDLLCVLDNYTFPLFYYKNVASTEVYSPMAVKSVYVLYNETPYFTDYNIIQKISYYFTEKHLFKFGWVKMNRCEPFNIDKYSKTFLQSNIRINLKVN